MQTAKTIALILVMFYIRVFLHQCFEGFYVMKSWAEGMGYGEGHPAMCHLRLNCLQLNTGVQVEEQGDVLVSIFGKELGQQVAVIQAALVVACITTNINNQPRNRFIIRWQDLFNEERVVIVIFFWCSRFGWGHLIVAGDIQCDFFCTWVQAGARGSSSGR